MGCCGSVNNGTNSRNNSSNLNPPANISKIRQLANAKFSPILELTHSMNINNKYDIHFVYDSSFSFHLANSFTGSGIKRTYSYVSKINPENLKKLRKEFWGNFLNNEETRIQGNKQVWNVLMEVCETDAGNKFDL